MAGRASEWEGDPNLGAMREEAQPWEEEVVHVYTHEGELLEWREVGETL